MNLVFGAPPNRPRAKNILARITDLPAVVARHMLSLPTSGRERRNRTVAGMLISDLEDLTSGWFRPS